LESILSPLMNGQGSITRKPDHVNPKSRSAKLTTLRKTAQERTEETEGRVSLFSLLPPVQIRNKSAHLDSVPQDSYPSWN
jgi:hypothetical protein